MTAFHGYHVGQPYITGRTNWPERTDYNYRGGDHELRLFFNAVSVAELREFKSDPGEFAFLVSGDVLVFLFRFGQSIPWSDQPFSIHLVPAAERQIPQPVEGIVEPHALLNTILVNARTGIILALRVVTFSPAFTAALHLAIRDQAARPWPGDREYDRQVAALYQKYPRTTLMLKDATARTIGGT